MHGGVRVHTKEDVGTWIFKGWSLVLEKVVEQVEGFRLKACVA